MAITNKPWDYALPFTRINSPSDSDDGGFRRLDGNGHIQGTRRPADFLDRGWLDLIIREKLARVAPSWVPTLGQDSTYVAGGAEGGDLPKTTDETATAVDQELQGTLVKSFQTWTDAPMLQWHRWYDWNFHVIPDQPFDWLRGQGNGEGGNLGEFDTDVPTTSGALQAVEDIPGLGWLVGKIASLKKGRAQYAVPGTVMECEWDTGVIGNGSDTEEDISGNTTQRYKATRPGPMYGPKDWAWPMPGHRMWLRGRSIYDGGHETEAKLCRSELHPVKAIAWARWEAFKFDENTKYVPAIQLMFFTSRYGGYVDHKDVTPIGGKPYEFIVDLPVPAKDTGPREVNIADSSVVNMNTIVLREPKLVWKADWKRYKNAGESGYNSGDGGSRQQARSTSFPEVEPDVKLLPLADGADPTRRQAKVTIPASALAGDCYGVLLAIGWKDYTGEAAAKVRKCTVTIKQVHGYAINHNIFSEHWRLKIAVNGRWNEFDITGVHNNKDHPINLELSPIYLSDDDQLEFTSHGACLNKVDQVYTGDGGVPGFHGKKSERMMTLSQQEIAEESEPGNSALNIALSTPFTIPELAGTLAAPAISPQGVNLSGGDRFPVVWMDHVDIRAPKNATDDVPVWNRMYPEQRMVARRTVTMMTWTLNDQNGPLGIMDGNVDALTRISADYDRRPEPEKTSNPFKLKGLATDGQPHDITLTAYQTWELGDSAELAERPHKNPADANNNDWKDYHIEFSIKIEPQ